MDGKQNFAPTSYKPNYHGFNKTLVRHRTHFFTPKHKDELHPMIQSIHYILDGKIDFFSKKFDDFANIFSNCLPTGSFINDENMMKLSKFYEVTIVIFYEKQIYGGRQITFHVKYGNYPEKIALLKSYSDRNYFAAILPTIDGRIDFLENKIYCNTHGDWVNHHNDFADHLKDCFKCKCGKQYYRGDKHSEKCDFNEKGDPAEKKRKGSHKRKDNGRITKYWKSEKAENPTKCYFADLETLIKANRKYTVYAAAFVDDDEHSDKVNLYNGPEAMNSFMNQIIEECNGVMWFFNGSKFDNLFLIPWLLVNNIEIEEGSTIIVGNSILSITFKTKVGSVTLKDLCKFLPGSLKANCKAFGLSQDASKGDLDHDKMNSWEAIEKYKDEVVEYLTLDVTCLKKIYRLFSEEMFNQYGLHVSQFMTATQLAYAAFTTTLKGPGSALWKTPIEDEKMMRSMYKGGRVICGRPVWKTTFWDEIKSEMVDAITFDKEGYAVLGPGHAVTREMYDKIIDYCHYVDANSLYPAAQVRRAYPTGKYTKKQILHDSIEEKRIINSINNRDRLARGGIFKAGFLVDITCPRDLTIAFLMTKSEKGEVQQNLLPKVREWFTGPELWEASKLSYTITRIYEVCQWATSKSIFDEFVIATYKVKSEAERDTPRYTCAKNMLNGLTGKFGQHVIKSVTLLYTKNQEITQDVKNITEIFGDDGKLLGWYAESEKLSDFAPFPIHLSAFILAWARIYMSKMLRRMKITTEGRLCPIYGDTDSLIIHKDAWAVLADKWKGDKELGQMKHEVKGKVIRVTVLAPKTYEVTYIDEKTLIIKSIVKSKGIPHPHDECHAFEEYKDTEKELERARKEILFLKNRESSLDFSKTVVIGSKNYIFKDKEGNIICACTRPPPDMFEKILNRQVSMECVFGGMVRKFEPGNIEQIYVAPDSKLRGLNVTDWWARGLRQLSPQEREVPFPTAYPQGHFMLDEPMNVGIVDF